MMFETSKHVSFKNISNTCAFQTIWKMKVKFNTEIRNTRYVRFVKEWFVVFSQKGELFTQSL